jgi:uncharacterized glyoxalase superfamily protein PhnB
MRTNRSAPTATIVPILVYADVEAAIAWLCGLGFTERLRATGPDGRVSHAQLSFGEGSVMIGREGGPFRAPSKDSASHLVHVTVEDVDAHHMRADDLGVEILRKPTTMPFGERQYTVMDSEGHRWTFSQHVADLAPEEWGARSARSPGP